MALAVILFTSIRDVAQPGSAHAWGAWGRKFESCHPDHEYQGVTAFCCNSFFVGSDEEATFGFLNSGLYSPNTGKE